MDAATPPRFRFEDFTLDVMRRRLSTGERDVMLRPKSLDVLVFLLQRPGRLATKDEIVAAVWPNVAVTDDSLTQCVSDIRRALGPRGQELIKTVPGRGYVFAAPVTVDSSDGPAPPGGTATQAGAPERTERRRRPLAAGAMVLSASIFVAGALAILAGGRLAPDDGGLPLPDRPSIAVLPFVDAGAEAGEQWLADGITEELTTSLSRFGELFVIAGNSAFRYRGGDADPGRIGRELGVRYLLQGNVRRNGERMRLAARLVEAESGRQLWAERYDRELGDVFAVQDELTEAIVTRLLAHITRSELERALRRPPQEWAAYEHYLRGNDLLKRAPRDTSGATIAAAREAYERSLAIDPRFAPALRGLAAADLMEWLNPYLLPALYRTSGAPAAGDADPFLLDRAARFARQAIDLDPTLAEAYATLGWVLHWRRGPRAAIRVFERAFELNPNLVEGRFANVLSHSGRAEEAIAFMQRMMRLDPFYPPVYDYFLGKAFFFAGRHEEAVEQVRAAADALPALRPVLPMYAASAALAGRDDEARAAAAKLLAIQPHFAIEGYLRFMRLAHESDRERLAEGLRKAGLPQ